MRVTGRPAILGGKPVFKEPVPFTRHSIAPPSKVFPSLKEIFGKSGLLTKGRFTERYEKLLAAYLGTPEAVAVSSCTTGLILTLKALAVHEGKRSHSSRLVKGSRHSRSRTGGEVLVPSFTFLSTPHAILWNGMTPVFVECHPAKLTMDPEDLERKISSDTVCILAVYVFGNPPPVLELEKIARKHHIPLIFDAAHAFGTIYRGKRVGMYGDAEVFSSSPTKLLTTGEGGAVTTTKGWLAESVRILREYGNSGGYDAEVEGMNGRIWEVGAALGIQALPYLEGWARHRNRVAALYKKLLGEIPGITFQEIEPHSRSSYKDFALLLTGEFPLSRSLLVRALETEGISTRCYFSPPMHEQRLFKGQSASRRLQEQGGTKRGASKDAAVRQPPLPVTEKVSRQALCLPISSTFAMEDAEKVCEALLRIVRFSSRIKAGLS